MYLCDKVALEDLNNYSICVKNDRGIMNIKSETDVIVGELVYVENIFPMEQFQSDKMKLGLVGKGTMARYRQVVVILR